MNKLLFVALGNRNSGKSRTWNELFSRVVKTGRHEHWLEVDTRRYVRVFLVSGSPEERKKYVGDIIARVRPRIVLCSVQYKPEARETFNYFFERGYAVHVQWLNPGFNDISVNPDSDGLMNFLLHQGATVSIRDGKETPKKRVREIRELVFGWAATRHLLSE
jgi:hypothetical protein